MEATLQRPLAEIYGSSEARCARMRAGSLVCLITVCRQCVGRARREHLVRAPRDFNVNWTYLVTHLRFFAARRSGRFLEDFENGRYTRNSPRGKRRTGQ